MQPVATGAGRRSSANRLNASRSTGPKSEAGKAKSRLNAIRHGLNSAPPTADVVAEAQNLTDEISNRSPEPDNTDVMALAEAIVNLRRVRAAKAGEIEALHSIQEDSVGPETLELLSDQVRKLTTLDGYERKAHSRMLRAFKQLE